MPVPSPRHPFLVIGHRGAKGLAPENTVRGVAAAISAGVDGIEVDVRCAHGRLWVIHDHRLEPTTNGTGILDDTPACELRKLDAGEGQPIPDLGEIIAATGENLLLNVELKDVASAPLVVGAIRGHIRADFTRSARRFLISSFLPEALRGVRERAPELRVGLLPEDGQTPEQAWRLARELGAESVHAHHAHVSRDLVDDAHAQGFKLLAYTVNSYREAGKLRDEDGADGIFTDFPDKMQPLRRPLS